MTLPNNKPLYWSVLTFDDWNLHVAATEEGLCFVGSFDRSFNELAEWARGRLPNRDMIRDDKKLQAYKDELVSYLQGKLTTFSLPIYYRGTPFQEAVWKALVEIPYGQTQSYSDIANHIRKPAAVRAVGAAIGANPILITIPCHRVIGKNGSLTGYRGGMIMKTKLLELERNDSTRKKELRQHVR